MGASWIGCLLGCVIGVHHALGVNGRPFKIGVTMTDP